MSTHGLSPAQMADALRDEAKHEMPTVAGRAPADLSAQLQAARAEVEKWYDAAHSGIDNMAEALSAAEARATQAEQALADCQRASDEACELLRFVQRQLVASGWSSSEGGCIARIDRFLAPGAPR